MFDELREHLQQRGFVPMSAPRRHGDMLFLRRELARAVALRKATKTMTNELTVLVPTHNRPAFLNRLLTYFSVTSLQSPMLIIDSSDPERLELNRQVIRHASDSLHLVHRIDTAGLIKKCRSAMSAVKTPYSIFCADDDFLICRLRRRLRRFFESKR